MAKKTGGPAFPQTELDKALYTHGGMTLRDYFAGQALAGLLSDIECNPTSEEAAKIAYDFAEAMILEKDKRNG